MVLIPYILISIHNRISFSGIHFVKNLMETWKLTEKVAWDESIVTYMFTFCFVVFSNCKSLKVSYFSIKEPLEIILMLILPTLMGSFAIQKLNHTELHNNFAIKCIHLHIAIIFTQPCNFPPLVLFLGYFALFIRLISKDCLIVSFDLSSF